MHVFIYFLLVIVVRRCGKLWKTIGEHFQNNEKNIECDKPAFFTNQVLLNHESTEAWPSFCIADYQFHVAHKDAKINP